MNTTVDYARNYRDRAWKAEAEVTALRRALGRIVGENYGANSVGVHGADWAAEIAAEALRTVPS